MCVYAYARVGVCKCAVTQCFYQLVSFCVYVIKRKKTLFMYMFAFICVYSYIYRFECVLFGVYD